MLYLAEKKGENLEQKLKKAVGKLQTVGDEALLVCLGEKSSLDPEKLCTILQRKGITFFGGVFPGLIYDGQHRERGLVINKFPLFSEPVLIEDLNNLAAMDNLLGPIKEKTRRAVKRKTALVLVDGLADNIDDFLAGIYNIFASSINYIGGGAGSLAMKQQPCVFCNQGVFANSGLVIPIDLDCGTGVRHGWKKVYSPFIATRTEGTRISELNWKPALEVYTELVNEDLDKSGQEHKISKDNFFEIAKGYPFGIVKENEESIVRDPIAVNPREDIVCVGSIPQNAVLDILKGEKENLIRAAGEAVKAAAEIEKDVTQVHSKMILDCISRVLFLEDSFAAEMEEIQQKSAEISEDIIAGALTIGEISSQGRGYIELYNKTTVAGVFYE